MSNPSVRYFALKRLKVGDGYREPGDEVPEAHGWRNVQAYINTSKLVVVPATADQVAGGLDFRAQAGRAESPRPAVKPEGVGKTVATPVVSPGADLNKLTAAQLVEGIEEGALKPRHVERFELERAEQRDSKPRKTVLRAAGWSEQEIRQGHREGQGPEEPEETPDSEYAEWTEAQLLQEWGDRFEGTPPDNRDGLIADLEADDQEREG